MEILGELIVLEPWSRFTAGLIAAMAVALSLDLLSTWIVTPRLDLEANPLMRRDGLCPDGPVQFAVTGPTFFQTVTRPYLTIPMQWWGRYDRKSCSGMR